MIYENKTPTKTPENINNQNVFVMTAEFNFLAHQLVF